MKTPTAVRTSAAAIRRDIGAITNRIRTIECEIAALASTEHRTPIEAFDASYLLTRLSRQIERLRAFIATMDTSMLEGVPAQMSRQRLSISATSASQSRSPGSPLVA